jgi:hypothetical protein
MIFNGAADALSALGLDGAVVDGLRNVGTTLAAAGDALQSFGTCAAQWATGSKHASDTVTQTSSAGEDAQRAGGFVAGRIASNFDKSTVSGQTPNTQALRDVNTLRATINLFTTNFSAYSQDPQKAWSGMADSIISCMQSKGQAMVDAGNQIGK